MKRRGWCRPRLGRFGRSAPSGMPGETISVGIGQGATIVTPLQLISAISSIAVWAASGIGRICCGRIRRRSSRRSFRRPERAIQDSISGMCGVVSEPGGTGSRARLPGIEVCGKTGSAQVASNKFLAGKHIKTNGWFVAFAPREKPEIAVVGMLENAGHGGVVAAPIVRDIMKAYFDKKAARQGRSLLSPSRWRCRLPSRTLRCWTANDRLPRSSGAQRMLRRIVRDFDWPMLLIVFVICGVGVVQIFSATRETGFQDVLVETTGLPRAGDCADVDHDVDRLSHVAGAGQRALRVVRGGIIRRFGHRQDGFGRKTLDSAARRLQLASIRVRQTGDTIDRSPATYKVSAEVLELRDLVKICALVRGPDGPGGGGTRPRDGADVPSDSWRVGSFFGRVSAGSIGWRSRSWWRWWCLWVLPS